MKRKEVIFEKLKEAGMHGGISAGELAKRLGLNRANVSRELNDLWREGKVRKQPGRPVRFSVPEPPRTGRAGSLRRCHHPGPVGGNLRQPEDGL